MPVSSLDIESIHLQQSVSVFFQVLNLGSMSVTFPADQCGALINIVLTPDYIIQKRLKFALVPKGAGHQSSYDRGKYP